MRFLCVHGMGTSGNILESQLAQIRSNLPGQHEFVFLDGGVESEPLYGIDSFFPGPYYCYYLLPTPDEVRDAYDLLDETIAEEGPFDGIIGFSQGGALASSYILNDLRSPSPQNPFKCAIFFCSSAPFDATSRPFCVDVNTRECRFADTNEPMNGFDISESIPEAEGSNGWSGTLDSNTKLLHRYTSSFANPEKAQITIPTCHIVGAEDDYRNQSLQLKELCTTQGRKFFEHRAGHEIPTDRNTTAKMAAEIQAMLQAVLVG